MLAPRFTRPALIAAMSALLLAPVGFAAEGEVERGSGGIGVAGSGGGGAGSAGDSSPATEGTFPIVGRHTYGDGLGAGRSHQGQDLLAKCGKPVVSAHPGRVRFKKYHGSAGNYVVVTSKKTRSDFVYMHLLEEARVSVGDRVAQGEVIGRVGSTGNSSACHLHFEMWSAPGWYRGGGVLDPTPHLKRWDR